MVGARVARRLKRVLHLAGDEVAAPNPGEGHQGDLLFLVEGVDEVHQLVAPGIAAKGLDPALDLVAELVAGGLRRLVRIDLRDLGVVGADMGDQVAHLLDRDAQLNLGFVAHLPPLAAKRGG